jgi:ADP-ribosylglycohydrolase
MYFAAVIAAAFGTSTLEDALQVGLRFIPRDCEFTRQVNWALDFAPQIKNYRDANQAVSVRFRGMHAVHAINNACLTIWGVFLGRDDFSAGISQTVAMSYDNDCTAATVGSILGAFMGIDAVPEFWSKPWNNTIVSYLNGMDEFKIDDLIQRFHEVKVKIAA